MTDLKILMQARALIAEPSKWIQREWDDGEGRYCAMGALEKVGQYRCVHKLRLLLVKELKRKGQMPAPMIYNDLHTHGEVLAMFDGAIAHELETWIGQPTSAEAEMTHA